MCVCVGGGGGGVEWLYGKRKILIARLRFLRLIGLLGIGYGGGGLDVVVFAFVAVIIISLVQFVIVILFLIYSILDDTTKDMKT